MPNYVCGEGDLTLEFYDVVVCGKFIAVATWQLSQ